MNFTMQNVFWLIVTFVVPGVFVFNLLFRPHRFVKWQGRTYKAIYKDALHMSDQEIDRRYQLPTDRFLMGMRSDFVRNASENPQSYTRLIFIYRVTGSILAFFLVLAFGLVLLGITRGAFL